MIRGISNNDGKFSHLGYHFFWGISHRVDDIINWRNVLELYNNLLCYFIYINCIHKKEYPRFLSLSHKRRGAPPLQWVCFKNQGHYNIGNWPRGRIVGGQGFGFSILYTAYCAYKTDEKEVMASSSPFFGYYVKDKDIRIISNNEMTKHP